MGTDADEFRYRNIHRQMQRVERKGKQTETKEPESGRSAGVVMTSRTFTKKLEHRGAGHTQGKSVEGRVPCREVTVLPLPTLLAGVGSLTLMATAAQPAALCATRGSHTETGCGAVLRAAQTEALSPRPRSRRGAVS